MAEESHKPLTQRLDERIAEGRRHERELMKQLRDVLVRHEFDDQLSEQVSGLMHHLDELFLLVVVGEVKAGKSSFINALLNADVCKVGAIPTTDKIHVIKHGDQPRERLIEEFLVEQQMPFEALRTLNIVDTPGTNSIVKRHAEITEGFIPRCDLILFTTSVDRPFSETEREFLGYIVQGWAKKIVFILTKKDIKTPAELEEIRGYVSDNVKKYFDFEPLIFTVSAKQARDAKHKGDNAAFADSGFAELEDYLFRKLSAGEKLQLKLESPVNSAISICDRANEEFLARMLNLKDDRRVLENIRQQLEQSEADMSENFGRFILEVDNIIYELESRGRNWLDDNVKITNPGLLRSAERFRGRFKEDVIKDFEMKIDEALNRAVDWFMKKYLKVWQDTTDYFSDQAARRPHEGMVGKVGSKFEYNRERIYDLVRADARNKVKNFDYDNQVRQFLSRSATGLNTAMGGMLIGTGGAIAVVALFGGFTWIDITGILGGLTLAGLALGMLPIQKRKMKAQFSDKCTELRAALTQVLDQQIKREAKESVDRIRESFGPFFDYVGRTSGAVEEALAKLKSIRDGLTELKRQFANSVREGAAALEPPAPSTEAAPQTGELEPAD